MQQELAYNTEYRTQFLKKFNEEHPECDTGIIGRSILGRDIDYYKLGNGGRIILAVGAHHGMEYITSAALYEFISFLAEKAARGLCYCGINLEFLLQKFTFWIVPCINPDGVEMQISGIEKTPLYVRQLKMNGGGIDFSDWQANARGVDLNHNYDAGFFEYKRLEEAEGIMAGKTRFSGEFPESEPETRSLASFIRTVMPDAIVSLHTQGEEIFSKPNTEYVRRIAARLTHITGYKHSFADGLSAYGGLCDYAGDNLNIPSFTVELGKGRNPLPLSSLRAISDIVRNLLILLPTYL